jgi:hypothetical protein
MVAFDHGWAEPGRRPLNVLTDMYHDAQADFGIGREFNSSLG